MPPRSRALAVLACGAVLAGACSTDPETAARRFVESGDRYVQQKQYRHAVIQYRNALQRHPALGEAHFKLGQAYERSGDGTAAARAYLRAAELLPDSPRAQVKAGQLELLAGEFASARARAERVLARERRHVDAQILRANALAGLNDLNAAVAQIQEAVHHHSGHSDAYANLGALQLARGHHDEAERAFRRAVSIAPHSVPARLAIANFYWVTGRPREAERSLNEGLKATRGDGEIRRALAYFYVSTDRAAEAERHLLDAVQSEDDTASKLALADYYELVERPEAALPLLESVAASDRDAAPDAVARVAAIYVALGRTAEAEWRLDALLAERPESAAAQLAKARLLLQQDRADDALPHVRRAVRADPDSFPARLWLARAQAARGAREEARSAYDALLEVRPRFVPALLELAQLHLEDGNAEEAHKLTARAREQLPDAADVLAADAEALHEIGRRSEAVTALRQAAAAAGDSADLHARVGSAFVAIGDLSAARTAYANARRLDPADPFVANNLAWLMTETEGDLDAALRLAQQALRQRPKRPEISHTVGRIYQLKGRAREALPFLRASVRGRPGNPTYRFHLARAYEDAGDASGACEAFRAALRLNAEFESAPEARSALRRLNGCAQVASTPAGAP